MSKKQFNLLDIASTYATPVAPAVAYGSHVYTFAIDSNMVWWLALMCGLTAAIALETVGVYAGKSSMKAFKQEQYLHAIGSIVALLAYVIIGMYELRGTPFMWLTLIAFLGYTVSGINEVLAMIDAEKAKQQELDREREQDRNKERQNDKERNTKAREAVRLAEIEAEKQIKLAQISMQASTVPAVIKQELANEQAIICSCGREFATVQSRNAHIRFCPSRLNGKVKKEGIIGG